MIWIVKGNESHEIISSNVVLDEDTNEVWVTRPNGKSLKIFSTKDANEAKEMKQAIDYAIKIGEKTFTIE